MNRRQYKKLIKNYFLCFGDFQKKKYLCSVMKLLKRNNISISFTVSSNFAIPVSITGGKCEIPLNTLPKIKLPGIKIPAIKDARTAGYGILAGGNWQDELLNTLPVRSLKEVSFMRSIQTPVFISDNGEIREKKPLWWWEHN